MKNKKIFLIVIYIVISNTIWSQNTFDIMFPGNDRDQICQECFQIFSQKSKEV